MEDVHLIILTHNAILPILNPARASARIAACAPGPGETERLPPGALTFTWTFVIAFSFEISATRYAAFIAAYGDASSFAAFTTIPPDHFVIVSAPVRSVTVMIILLKEAKICAIPHLTISYQLQYKYLTIIIKLINWL